MSACIFHLALYNDSIMIMADSVVLRYEVSQFVSLIGASIEDLY